MPTYNNCGVVLLNCGDKGEHFYPKCEKCNRYLIERSWLVWEHLYSELEPLCSEFGRKYIITN